MTGSFQILAKPLHVIEKKLIYVLEKSWNVAGLQVYEPWRGMWPVWGEGSVGVFGAGDIGGGGGVTNSDRPSDI